jgi:hypothetical protein
MKGNMSRPASKARAGTIVKIVAIALLITFAAPAELLAQSTQQHQHGQQPQQPPAEQQSSQQAGQQ